MSKWNKEDMSKDELLRLVEEMEKRVHFYEEAINSLPNPIFIKNDDLQFIFFNQSYKDFFEVQEGQYIGMGVKDLPYLTMEERQRYHEEDSDALNNSSIIHYEANFPRGDYSRESLYWSKGFESVDGVKGLIGEIVDISKQKRLEEKLQVYVKELKLSGKRAEYEAMIDPNTAVYNRRVLENYVPNIIEKCQETGMGIYVYLMDIDFFKYINDNFGHPEGDKVLRKFARVLKNTIRNDDIIIRYGGDEFLLILLGMSENRALDKAKEISEAIRNQVILADGNGVSMSIGVAPLEENSDLESTIHKADLALYAVKRAGRGHARMYDKESMAEK